mgnify:CR=1 FL=1
MATNKLGPYSKYKFCDMPYVSSIPESWEVYRLGMIGRFSSSGIDKKSNKNEPSTKMANYLDVYNNERHILDSKRTYMVVTAPKDKINQHSLRLGEVLFTPSSETRHDIGWSAVVSEDLPDVVFSYHLTKFKSIIEIDLKFSKYFCNNFCVLSQFSRLCNGTTRYVLSRSDFRNTYVAIPPLKDQVKIGLYIDYKYNRINKYIRIKKRQIELLKELKQVIISDAVTGKIDVHTGKPYSNYIDSGIEWMELVPKEWDLFRLKHISNIIRGKFSHRPRNDPSLYDGEFPFIQTGDIAQASKYVTTFHQTLNAKGFTVSKEFPKGTLTMTIAANIGEVAILEFKACFPDSIVGFVPYSFVSVDYLYYVFLAMKPELIKQAPVNTQGNLNIERISTLRVVLPQVDLQKDIVRYIESRITNIDKSIEWVNNEIRKLKELRTRLISDVVTGKLDVRKVEVPDLPEDELEPEFEPDEELVEESLYAN